MEFSPEKIVFVWIWGDLQCISYRTVSVWFPSILVDEVEKSTFWGSAKVFLGEQKKTPEEQNTCHVPEKIGNDSLQMSPTYSVLNLRLQIKNGFSLYIYICRWWSSGLWPFPMILENPSTNSHTHTHYYHNVSYVDTYPNLRCTKWTTGDMITTLFFSGESMCRVHLAICLKLRPN